MMQQVNLLTPELMPRHEPLTLRHLMMVWAGFSVPSCRLRSTLSRVGYKARKQAQARRRCW